jgi:hypothetical protein
MLTFTYSILLVSSKIRREKNPQITVVITKINKKPRKTTLDLRSIKVMHFYYSLSLEEIKSNSKS